MKIKVWGSRGTLPTPGPHSLKYGGNTTCIEIRNKMNYPTIIDAGSGIRLFGKELMKEEDTTKICLMLTHSHWDHLMGFPFFLPAYFSKFNINVCGIASARNYMKHSLARQLEAPYFPVDFSQLKANFSFGCSMPGCDSCRNLKIKSIKLNHPNGGLGYKFSEDGKTFVFLTDNELGDFRHENGLHDKDYEEFSRGADLLFHDAQYTDEQYKKTKGWGHSTFNAAVELAINAKVKRLGLFHHDPDRKDDDLDKIVANLNANVADRGIDLDIFVVAEGSEFIL